MNDTNIVRLPGQRRQRIAKGGDEQLAMDIRRAYAKLQKAIDAATKAGLKCKVFLDSTDTYGGGLVRGKEIVIERRL